MSSILSYFFKEIRKNKFGLYDSEQPDGEGFPIWWWDDGMKKGDGLEKVGRDEEALVEINEYLTVVDNIYICNRG